MSISERKSRHVASLARLTPRFESPAGSVSSVDFRDLPILRGLSIRRLLLGVHCVREPHWHTNAHELGYSLRGEALVTIGGNHAQRESFTVAAGEMFFVQCGAMHAIEDTGDAAAEFVLAFSHEKPEDFGMKFAFGAMSDAVLGNTYDLPAAAFAGFDRLARGSEILSIPRTTGVEAQARRVNPYKYSIEALPPQIDFPAGMARTARAPIWPVLRDSAMYSVTITREGMREPHWHPETAEMGFVIAGMARTTIGVAAAAALGVRAWLGWEYWAVWRFEEATDDAYVQADIVIIAPQVAGILRVSLFPTTSMSRLATSLPRSTLATIRRPSTRPRPTLPEPRLPSRASRRNWRSSRA